MAAITTKTIIKFLQLDPKETLDLLETYDTLPIDEQVRITTLAWNTLADYEKLKLKENFEKGIQEAAKNKTPLGSDYYQKIAIQTEKEIDDQLSVSQETVDITEARKSMELIAREINASKATKPVPTQTAAPKTS